MKAKIKTTKTNFVTTDDLLENSAGGGSYTYLVAKSAAEMEKLFDDIKTPFHIVSAYGMNNRHYVLVNFLNTNLKVKRTKGV